MKHYETVFILNPVLSGDQVKEAVKKYKALIRSNGGEMLAYEDWGLKKLAYPIRYKKTGFYHLMEFKTDNGDLPAQLELQFKRDEGVMRFLTINLDKHALKWAEERRTRLKKQKSKKDEKA